jgi:NADH-quinone oxidoreductase subunit J
MVAAGDSNTQSLGIALYTHYIYPVEIAAVLLLVAIVAAIALTLRERKDVKGQNVADQVRVRAKDRLEIVKVAPVKPAAPAKENSEENPS